MPATITVSTIWTSEAPIPPALAAIQLAAPFMCGWTRARSDSGLPAIPRHAEAIRSPTRGMLPSQSGGGGSPSVAREYTNLPTTSALSAMVEMPTQVGTTSRVSRARTITATAGPRRPPSLAWTAIKTGQVATTIIVAQTTAAAKGSITQMLAPVIAPRARTPRVMRGRSCDGGETFTGCPWRRLSGALTIPPGLVSVDTLRQSES